MKLNKTKKITQDALRAVSEAHGMQGGDILHRWRYSMIEERMNLRLCTVLSLFDMGLDEESLMCGLEIGRVALANNLGRALLARRSRFDFWELYNEVSDFLCDYINKNVGIRALLEENGGLI